MCFILSMSTIACQIRSNIIVSAFCQQLAVIKQKISSDPPLRNKKLRRQLKIEIELTKA